jgi:tRNA 2-thiouridine synthesizing protein B
MATLHLVNKASALEHCLTAAAADDAILLLEDGVYAAVSVRAPKRQLYALKADVTARGLRERLSKHTRLVDDAGFVGLVEAHQPVVTWR